MDPVSAIGLAVNVANLASVVRNIVSNMFVYYETVKDAPKYSRELRQEMAALCDTLESLEALLTAPASNSPLAASTSLKTSLSEFHAILGIMNARVAMPQTRGLRRLKWPFTKAENERYIANLERYKGTFNLALDINIALKPIFAQVADI